MPKKRVKRYTWLQIRKAIETTYEHCATPDGWGVLSMYKDSMILGLKRHLPK